MGNLPLLLELPIVWSSRINICGSLDLWFEAGANELRLHGAVAFPIAIQLADSFAHHGKRLVAIQACGAAFALCPQRVGQAAFLCRFGLVPCAEAGFAGWATLRHDAPTFQISRVEHSFRSRCTSGNRPAQDSFQALHNQRPSRSHRKTCMGFRLGMNKRRSISR